MNTESTQELTETGVVDYIQKIKVKAVRWNGHNLGDIVSLRNESILATETDSDSWAKTCTSSMNVGDWLVLDELKMCFLIKSNEEFESNFKKAKTIIWKQVSPEECLQWQLKNVNCEALRKMSKFEYSVKYRFGFFYSQHGGDDATEWVYSQDPGNPAYKYFIPEEDV